MTISTIYIFASVFLVSLVSLLGIFFLFLRKSALRKFTELTLGLAIGALLGGATIHLLPSAAENIGLWHAFAFTFFGFLSFAVLEKILHWRHAHDAHSIKKSFCKSCGKELQKHKIKPLGKLVIFSDLLHNALDGALIAGAFALGAPSGFAATVAVLLHEIPQEIADFGLLLHSGYGKAKAVLFNFLSGLGAFAGALAVILAGALEPSFLAPVSAFAAGSLLYIALADLVPEIKNKRGEKLKKQILAIISGFAVVALLKLLD